MIAPLILLAALASVPVCTGADSPFQCKDRDVLIHNARIWTGEVDAPVFHEAMLLRGGKVVAVGPVTQVERLARANRYTVNLGGRTVLPGMVDIHSHVAMLGKRGWLVDMPHPATWAPGPGPGVEEVRTALAARASATPLGQPIVFFFGARFYAELAATGETIRSLINGAAPGHLAVGIEWSGHVFGAGDTVLALAGIRDYQPDPAYGWRGRDELGRLNGLLQELAMLPVARLLSDRVSDAEYAAQHDAYSDGMLARGLVLTADIRFVYSDERAETVRLRMKHPETMLGVCIITYEGKLCPPSHDGTIRRKIFMDGTHVGRSALMSLPYLLPEELPAGFAHANDGRGIRNQSDAQVQWALDDVLRRGGQLAVHAIGDEGIGQLLRVLRSYGGRWDGLVTVEHFDMASPAQVAEAVSLGVTVGQNNTHLLLIPPMAARWNQPELVEHSEPLRSVLAAGGRLAFGTDAFGSDPACVGSSEPKCAGAAVSPNPWLDVYLGVIHPYHPDEAVTVGQALGAYTREAARARLLPSLGTLAPGKDATFFVASSNPFSVPTDALPAITSCLTVVSGKTEWADRSCW